MSSRKNIEFIERRKKQLYFNPKKDFWARRNANKITAITTNSTDNMKEKTIASNKAPLISYEEYTSPYDNWHFGLITGLLAIAIIAMIMLFVS